VPPLAGLFADGNTAPPDILPAGHWFEMVRVYTRPVTAKMIQLEFRGDGTHEQFIGDTVD